MIKLKWNTMECDLYMCSFDTIVSMQKHKVSSTPELVLITFITGKTLHKNCLTYQLWKYERIFIF